MIYSSNVYVNPIESTLKIRPEDKSKWQSPKNFWGYFPKHISTNDIENYVVRDFSEPASSHRFRIVEKAKWVAGSFKPS